MRGLFSFLFVLLLVIGCSSTQIAIEDAAKEAALIAARPVLEKIFLAEAPIGPSNRELFPTLQKLPGKPFDPRKYFGNSQHFSQGVVEFPSGDYIIPVMSYCMKSSGSSPTAHRYLLGRLSGHASRIIHDLNARALSKFPPGQVQATSWSIQNGVAYSEMSDESKRVVDAVIPEHRKELEKSFFKVFSEKWDGVAGSMGLPRFEEMTDQTLGSLGEFGEALLSLREFRRTVRESGGNYENLKSLISLPGNSENPGTETTTPWSQIAENVYARFLTSGHFLDVGELQIRVGTGKRAPQAAGASGTKIDIANLIADPGAGGIQPLSFSALSGMLAVDALPASASPALIAAVIAAILAEKYVDWDAFAKAVEKFGNSAKDLIQKGIRALSKEHDELEKPLRDLGIINENSKDISDSPTGARNYKNPGGKSGAERDFEKIPGKEEPPNEPGVRVKTLPNGERAVLRTKDKTPTIEMQPKGAGRQGDTTRVKVRYP